VGERASPPRPQSLADLLHSVSPRWRVSKNSRHCPTNCCREKTLLEALLAVRLAQHPTRAGVPAYSRRVAAHLQLQGVLTVLTSCRYLANRNHRASAAHLLPGMKAIAGWRFVESPLLSSRWSLKRPAAAIEEEMIPDERGVCRWACQMCVASGHGDVWCPRAACGSRLFDEVKQ